MTINIPTFITKEAVVRPDLLAETPDPKTDVTHTEWNALVGLAVATAQEVNTASPDPNRVLWSWNGTDVSQIAPSVLRANDSSGNGGGSGSDFAATVVADPDYPARNCIRLSGSSIRGVRALALDIDLSAEPDSEMPLVLEISGTWRDSSTIVSGVTGLLVGVGRASGTRVDMLGMGMRQIGGAANVDLVGSSYVSGTYAPLVYPTTLMSQEAPTSVRSDRGGTRFRVRIHRPQGDSPSKWIVRAAIEGTENNYSGVRSATTDAIAGWNGVSADKVIVGIYSDAVEASHHVDLADLVVRVG